MGGTISSNSNSNSNSNSAGRGLCRNVIGWDPRSVMLRYTRLCVQLLVVAINIQGIQGALDEDEPRLCTLCPVVDGTLALKPNLEEEQRIGCQRFIEDVAGTLEENPLCQIYQAQLAPKCCATECNLCPLVNGTQQALRSNLNEEETNFCDAALASTASLMAEEECQALRLMTEQRCCACALCPGGPGGLEGLDPGLMDDDRVSCEGLAEVALTLEDVECDGFREVFREKCCAFSVVLPPTDAPGRDTMTPLPLRILGDNGQPPEVYPLFRCDGDCDSDSDCSKDLICYHRDAKEQVPGCLNGEEDTSATDYCVPKSATPAPTEAPDEPESRPNPASCAVCEDGFHVGDEFAWVFFATFDDRERNCGDWEDIFADVPGGRSECDDFRGEFVRSIDIDIETFCSCPGKTGSNRGCELCGVNEGLHPSARPDGTKCKDWANYARALTSAGKCQGSKINQVRGECCS